MVSWHGQVKLLDVVYFLERRRSGTLCVSGSGGRLPLKHPLRDPSKHVMAEQTQLVLDGGRKRLRRGVATPREGFKF